MNQKHHSTEEHPNYLQNKGKPILLAMTLMAMIAVGIVSCSRSAQQSNVLSEGERIVYAYPDSALLILEDIDPSDLKVDSLKARYAIKP